MDEKAKELCLKFFYHWYNAKGNNTEQGYTDWIKTEEGVKALNELKKSINLPAPDTDKHRDTEQFQLGWQDGFNICIDTIKELNNL